MTDEQSTPDVIFENRYEITVRTFRSWDKFSLKNNPFRFLPRIVYLLFLVTFLIPCAYDALFHGNAKYFVYAVCSLIMIAFMLAASHLRTVRWVKNAAKASGEKKLLRTLRFVENNFEDHTNNIFTTFPYDQVRYLYENDKYCYLWLAEGGGGIVVEKNAFSIGDPDEFGLFIWEKCSEKRPLLTARRQNLSTLKKHFISSAFFIILIAFLIPLLWGPMLRKITNADTNEPVSALEQVLEVFRKNDAQVIAVEELSGGAVVFGVDDLDTIAAAILRKSSGSYIWVDAHEYSITSITQWTKQKHELFESRDGLLTFESAEWSIVYGVIESRWWDTNFSETEKSRYTAVGFQCGAGDFVLYYRDTVGSEGGHDVNYSFASSNDPEVLERFHSSSSWNILNIALTKDGPAKTQGQLLHLFGEPLFITPDYENIYSYLIIATDHNGTEYLLEAYHGPSGPAIGGNGDIPGIREAAKELERYVLQADTADFEWEGYYLDIPVRIHHKIENGIISYADAFMTDEEAYEVSEAWRKAREE